MRHRLTPAQKALVTSSEAQQLVQYATRLFTFLSPNAPVDELTSVANEELVRAARRYDPTHGARFATYASKGVVGRLTDRLTAEARFQQWRNAIAFHSLALQPSLDSARDTPDQATERLHRRLGAAFAARAVAALAAVDPLSPEQSVSLTQQWHRAIAALKRGRAQLPRDQAVVIQRHFYEGVSVEAVASEIGCSRSAAYRLRKEALDRLCRFLIAEGVTPIEASA